MRYAVHVSGIFRKVQNCSSGFRVVDGSFVADFGGAKMTSLCFKCCSNVKNIVNLLQISFLPTLYQACLTDMLKNYFLFVLKNQCMNV